MLPTVTRLLPRIRIAETVTKNVGRKPEIEFDSAFSVNSVSLLLHDSSHGTILLAILLSSGHSVKQACR